MPPLRPIVAPALPALALAIAYVAIGMAALQLAIPPGYATPLYPPAGISLAVVLVYGWRALPGVALGAFAVNVWLSSPRGAMELGALAVPLAVGAGATAQAAFGAWLVRRQAGRPFTLDEPRDIARFFLLGGPVACVVSAGVATTALSLAGVIGPAERTFTAWTWWMGDSLGVLIAAPITLTLIGRPRSDWQPRRTTVALPLLVATLLLALATGLVAHWDAQRTQAAFERSANATADAMESKLREPLQALEAARGLYLGSDSVSQFELARAVQVWLDGNLGLQAIGHSQRVALAEVQAFEARARAEGMPGYRVFNRSEIDRERLARDGDVVAIRHIAPLAGNAAALGVNALSIPAAREAIERSAQADRAAATAGFRLTQESAERTGIVIYRALYRGTEPPPPAERRRELSGVVFVTLRVDDLARAVMERAPSYLQWCLRDVTPAAPRPHLAGEAGCAARTALPLQVMRAFDLGGRRWELRLDAREAELPFVQHWNAWLFSGVGLLAAAMLGAMQLTVTGRARRIEQLVAERTADLRREVAQRKKAQEALQDEATERERAQAQLQDSRQQLRDIVDYLPVGVRYTDLGGRLIEVNPAYCSLTGYRADELLGMDVRELHHPEDRIGAARSFDGFNAGTMDALVRELRYITKSGAERWVRVTARRVGRPGDPGARTVGVVEDITEHLLLGEAERARRAAEAASRAKSEFVSRMSHELRTPLNAMLGFAQLLELDQRPSLAGHQAEWTAQIQHAGWHLLHMINDTLDLSRIEAGTIKLEPTPVDLPALLATCVAMVEREAQRKGVDITQQLDPAARTVLADPTRLKQIVTNLLSNAVKYNMEGGSVLVSVRRQDGMVGIAVADTGLGMSQEQLGQLFQPFNRLGRERGAVEGTGIGLVISRRLAELMGGTLTASSDPGEGSVFALTVPVPADADAAADMPAAHAVQAAGYRRRVVLYIEDNETNAEVMHGILAQRPQVALELRANGLEGLEAARALRPSLILLDMHLPDLTGLELLRQLRSEPALSGVPVVVVSADATTAAIEQAFVGGATDYVTKPINVPGFLAVIDRALEDQDTVFG